MGMMVQPTRFGSSPPPASILRGTSVQYANASTITIGLPAGSATGDLAYIFTGHAWGAVTPSGWTSILNVQGSNYNGAIFTKILSSGDISTGSVTITYAGSFGGSAFMATFVGNHSTRALAFERNGSGSNTRTVTTNASPQVGDKLVASGMARSSSAASSTSLTTAEQAQTGTNSSGVMRSGDASSSGAQAATITYVGASSSGDFQAIIAVSTAASTCNYSNTGGSGNRSAIITVTATSISAGGGTPGDLVSGTQADSYWWNNGTGTGAEWLEFDFGASPKIIDQFFLWESNTAFIHGTWRFEGWNGSAWIQIGVDFTLQGVSWEVFSNSTAYAKYRLRHMSGARSNGAYLREIDFRIA